MKYFFLLFPLLTFGMDDFERDLSNLKAKYQGEYKKEEQIKWQEVIAKEEAPSLSDKFHQTIRHLDLAIFLNYYFFNSGLPPDSELNGMLSSAGPDLDILIKVWNAFDIYLYGNYGVTGQASFSETTSEYSVPNNYLLGLGAYFFNGHPKISPYFSFEAQEQSFVGVNNNLDYSQINILTQLQGSQVTSFNITTGMDIPLNLLEKEGLVRIYLSPSIVAKSELVDKSYEEYISQFQFGIKLKYLFYKSMSIDLGYRGGFYKGQNDQNFNLLFLNLGYRF